MAEQIIFFEKNKCDYSDSSVSATASQGSDYAEYPLNRSNNTGWVTTGSVDADNTTWTVDMANAHKIDNIIMVLHNFKSYQIKYWDGDSYEDFSPAINETINAEETTNHEFTEITTTKIQVTIYGTITENEDKIMKQFIASKKIGQFNTWPTITPIISRNKKVSTMLSGKKSVREFAGFYKYDLALKMMRDTTDLELIESLYDSNDGFLVWICGGDESQFYSALHGYRKEDIKLVKTIDEYKPKWYEGLYQAGIEYKMQLEEVTD